MDAGVIAMIDKITRESMDEVSPRGIAIDDDVALDPMLFTGQLYPASASRRVAGNGAALKRRYLIEKTL